MAIERTITNVPETEQDRTWRMNIETPVDGDYSAQAFRETVQRDAQGNIVGQPVKNMSPLNWTLEEFLTEDPVTITLEAGGTAQVTPEMILKALPIFCDRKASPPEEAQEPENLIKKPKRKTK